MKKRFAQQGFSMSERLLTPGTIEAELEAHGVYASNTRGSSMEPLFRNHRDMVIISKPERAIKKYDVVLYPKGEEDYILHRVIAVRDDCYVIRGDNTFIKERVPKQAIIGVLTEFNRKGKRHSVRDLSYRIYSRVWCWLYPVRAMLRGLRILLGRARRAIFPKKKR